MKRSIKEKTSVTLSPEVLSGLDRIAGSNGSRSALIEEVLLQFIRARERAEAEARDLTILNKAADRLNAEMEDVLGYQTSEG
jgi:hypothetical protein